MEENVIVSVRARPLNEKEILCGGLRVPWKVDKESNSIHFLSSEALSFISPTESSKSKLDDANGNTLPGTNLSLLNSLKSSPGNKKSISNKLSSKSNKFLEKTTPIQPNNRPSAASHSRPSTPLKSSPSIYSNSRPQTPTKSPSKPQSTNVVTGFSSPASLISPSLSNTKDPRRKTYTFDYMFDPYSVTKEIYDKLAANIVGSCMEGINGTIFAYGQTSSGKTFTMKGEGKKNLGIIPLSISQIFDHITQTAGREFLLRVSYLEIYNEVINDLLAPENVNLKIHEDKKRGVFVQDLKEEVVVSVDHVISLIAAGEAYRHMGSTDYNEQSSRSHTIFRMVIESKEINDSSSPVRLSVLNLIDLAGSEKASYETVSNGDGRRKEGAYINKSLLTLGKVISKLSECPTEGTHIPFRDSKLTRILQNSLSGNARVAIICTISLSPSNLDETISTLKFASRAKNIVNKAEINEIMDDKALIKKYQAEITELRKKLDDAEVQEKQIEDLKVQKEKFEEEHGILSLKLQEQQQLIVDLQEKIKQLTKTILVASSVSKTKDEKETSAKSSRHSRSNSFVLSSDEILVQSPEGSSPPASPRRKHSSENITNGLKRNVLVKEDTKKLQESINKCKEENAKLTNQVARLTATLHSKEGEILLLKSNLSLLEKHNRSLKEKNETLKESSEGSKDMQHMQVKGDELLTNMSLQHLQKSISLENKLIETQLELHLAKADNQHLIEQLEVKESAIKEWCDTTEQLQRIIGKLEQENEQLRRQFEFPPVNE